MRWQDIAIATAQTCFVLALIPSIRSSNKPAAITSIVNVFLLIVITFSLFTLKLWFSAVTAGAVSIAWLILAIQKLKIDKTTKL